MRLGTSVGVALILLSSRGPHAQGQDKNPLARVKTLKCTFSVYASGNWKSGDPRGEVKAEDVVLQVEGIDAQEGTAQIVGAGPTHIKAVEADGAYPDYMPIEKDAAAMKTAFAAALTFWQEKKVDDATNLAQAGAKGVEDLQTAMKEKSYDGVVTAAATIGRTCAACHMAHREPLADGTFEIK